MVSEMKEKYEQLEMEVITFETEDVITASRPQTLVEDDNAYT